MENKELQFKTNLNCGGCVSKVKADLDHELGASNWNVDTDNPDKILTVSITNADKDKVTQIVKSKGFNIKFIA